MDDYGTDVISNEKQILLGFPGKYKSTNPQIPLNLFHVNELIHVGDDIQIVDIWIENICSLLVDNPLCGIACQVGCGCYN